MKELTKKSIVSVCAAVAFCGSSTLLSTTVSAKEDSHSVDYSMNNSENPNYIPDNVVTDDMIKVGEDYAKAMNNPKLRTDGEVWTLQSQQTVVSYRPIKAGFGDIIPIGKTRSKNCSWSINAGTKINNYTLSATISRSQQIAQSGPSSSDKLANGKTATHRAFFTVGYGRLVKYTFRVTGKYSGHYIRTATRYMYSDVSTVSCSQLIQLNGSTVYAEDVTRKKVKNAGTLANYKARFSKVDGTCLAYYKW